MARTSRRNRVPPPSQQLALPAELVVGVLEYLSTKDLWIAARVSRQLYAAAWRAGLIIHRKIDIRRTYGAVFGSNELKAIVEHALLKDLRISLTLVCHNFDDSPDVRPPSSVYDALQPDLVKITAAITAGLPLLVNLAVEVPDCFRPLLLGALQHPAPRLRSLKLSIILNDAPCAPPLSPDVFAGSAPQLRDLSLSTIALPAEPVAAFSSVKSVALAYKKVFQVTAINLHFPCITSLHLHFFAAAGAASPEHFGLSDLALRRLIVEDRASTGMEDAIQRSINLSTVPVVRAIGRTIKWTESLWSRDSADVSVRLSLDGDICISVAPEHLRWRRHYRVAGWDASRPLPIQELPGICTRLTYLRVEAPLLRSFLRLGLTLSALRDFRVDLRAGGRDFLRLWPLTYEDENIRSFLPSNPAETAPSPCPALAEITLFARDAPITGFMSRRAAFLARALGQVERPLGDKAALSLVGVVFARPVARTLLKETVSEVNTYAFAGRGSCEDYDDGLWEDGF